MKQRPKTRRRASQSPEAATQRRVKLNGTEWIPTEFARAADSIAEVSNLSNDDLFRVCQGAHHCYRFHYLADFHPFFFELWKRIKDGRIPNIRTKTEACRRIGCSLRWAEEIVAGTAHDPKRSAKPEPTDDDIALEISQYADETLSLVNAEDGVLYKEICERLATHFEKQANTEVRSGRPEGET